MWIVLPPFIDAFVLPFAMFFATASSAAAGIFLLAGAVSHWFDAG